MVSIPVTVTDPLNRYVTGLDKSSFRIFEDGAQQAISSLRVPDSNISVTVVSNGEGDRSGLDRTIAETENELAQLRRIYKDSYPDVVRLKSKLQELNTEKYTGSSMNSLQGEVFRLEAELARLENERVNVGTQITSLKSELGTADSSPSDGGSAQRAISRNKIDSEIALSNALLLNNQHDREFRRRELEGLRREIDDAANQSSSLLNRLSAAIDNALATPETKHAIVVEFDARDKSILWPENELHALIQRSTVRVYAVGVQTPGETSQSEPSVFLSLLTKATGGREFKVATWAEVPQIERKIEIELQNEYTATYLPGNRSVIGTYHRIEVRVDPIRGLPELHAYTRPGYYTTSP
jgi:VWFA-related protein